MDSIWQGQIFKDENHLKILHLLLQDNINYYGDFRADLDTRCSESELIRVQKMKKYFVWTPVAKNYFEKFAKSEATSKYFLAKASELEERNVILRCLNLAIAFGRINESEQGMAYFKRATFFQDKMNRIDLAEKDLELAMENKYLEAKFNSAGMKIPQKIGLQLEQIEKQFFQLSSPNLTIGEAEEFVQIDYQPECGKRLVVTKNVDAGEKLAVQEPYVGILKNILNWDTEHCHCCFKPVLAPIPCHECTFAFFCSETCRLRSCDAEHKYEHNYLSYLHSVQPAIALRDILAARIVCKLGPQQLFELYMAQNANQDENLAMKPKNHGFSTRYSAIHDLVTHPSHIRPLEKISNTFKALLLLNLLEETSNFFEEYVDKLKPGVLTEFRDFVASIILRHMENIPFNAISMSKLDPQNSDDTVCYAMGLFSLLCLCNHSCDPNAVLLRRPNVNSYVSLIALRNLKAGEEILYSYAPEWTKMDALDRMRFATNRYNFKCRCVPCVNGWGISEWNNLEKVENLKLDKAENLILRKNFLAAIDLLKSILTELTRDYSPKCFNTIRAKELLKMTLVSLANQ